MTKVYCSPFIDTVATSADVRTFLYKRSSDASIGSVGAQIPELLKKHNLQPTPRAWDFLSIALSVIAADESCDRTSSADGWTRVIDLTVEVADWKFWATQQQAFQEALRFLTGDIWTVTFVGGGYAPTPMKKFSVRPETVVSLLSGGMDSLIGAIDLVSSKAQPLFVSQVAKGDKKDQADFAKKISPKTLHLQFNHNARPAGKSERSQRGRSMAFFGLGVVAATCTQKYLDGGQVELIVPENGYISLNVPLTPLRLGTLSTRTTHPYYLNVLQKILDAAGFNLKLRNPYQFQTKGEMLIGCKNQRLLGSLVSRSTSCGRYARTGFQQCGRCVPCLVRRASFVKWGKNDKTDYKYAPLGRPDAKHRDFDDVRSAAFAVLFAQDHGIDRWIGGSINGVNISDRDKLCLVAERGLGEIEAFLKQQSVI